MLQHLWTGPISNAPVDVVQGAKSVEVRPVGITKGGCMARVLQVMAEQEGREQLDLEFVLCIGHFLQVCGRVCTCGCVFTFFGCTSTEDVRRDVFLLIAGWIPQVEGASTWFTTVVWGQICGSY